MRSLIIYAPNVGTGGGLVLLLEMLKADWPGFYQVAILDRRAQAQIADEVAGIEVHWSDPSLSGRWKAERLVSRLATTGDVVLCFHNLPPVLHNLARVFVYVQNAYLVGLIPKSHLRGWVKWRCAVERFIARGFRHRVDRYMVQTGSMALALAKWFGPDVPPIDILPFAAEKRSCVDNVASSTVRQWDFIFISDGAQHKNHDRLFTAWEMLANSGQFPSLAVTLHRERDAALRERLRTIVTRSGARIYDLGFLPHADVLIAYRHAGALIFPSYAESFGIPLLEAKAAGLPILAPELDYVRDLIDPDVTFDPTSVRSIARAVTRFIGAPSDHLKMLSGQGFADAVTERAAIC